jgi:hypothetical protein
VGAVLTAGDGAEFPTLGTGDYFYATLTSIGGTQEIVKATARVGDTVTIARAQEGTTAQSFAAGSRFESRVTAQSVLDTGRYSETVSVKDYGAVGDGATDDTIAFSSACAAAVGAVNFVSHGISRALSATVRVPAGNYLLSNFVDTANKDILFELDSGAAIINPNNLNGRFVRNGRAYRAPVQTRFGSEDQATGFSVTTGKGGNEGAEVDGFTGYAQVSLYADRDSVSLFTENVASAPLATLTGATFTSTTVVPISALTANQIKQLRVGMFIDTNHSPNKYTGWITSWAADGTSITVEGWYLVNGTLNLATTPSSPATAYLNPVTKIWALNANTTIAATSHAESSACAEFGIIDLKAPATGVNTGVHYTWGVDVVNLGAYKAQALFVARGQSPGAFAGYRADAVDIGLFAANADGGKFLAVGNTGPANNVTIRLNGEYRINNNSGGSILVLTSDGNLDLGNGTTTATKYIDFSCSGVTSDYDVRIQASSGSASTGQGVLEFFSARTTTLGVSRIGAPDVTDAILEIGAGATGNRSAYIDFVGDTTYTDYGLRIQRGNIGANAPSNVQHRGTGDFKFTAQEAASIVFATSNAEVARLDTSGRLLLGTNIDAGGALLQINGNRIRVGVAKTPSSASDTGTLGEICWDSNYIYVCVATNTWKRTAIASWP